MIISISTNKGKQTCTITTHDVQEFANWLQKLNQRPAVATKKTVHPMIPCPECGIKYKNNAGLSAHLRLKH